MLPLGIYRHYKGKLYELIARAYHHETLEELAVYKALYADPKLGNEPIFVRPKEEFFGQVEWEGKKMNRFELQK